MCNKISCINTGFKGSIATKALKNPHLQVYFN
uniref:Uncharacterized protein n=1 Tax=Rhizophora mucronata TaxID=61149 RepID=A0A2P2NWE4_RHIMU